MVENRTAQIMVNIEPTLLDLLDKMAKKYKMSHSTYARQLIINDLIAQGLVTPSIMELLLTGRKR